MQNLASLFLKELILVHKSSGINVAECFPVYKTRLPSSQSTAKLLT